MISFIKSIFRTLGQRTRKLKIILQEENTECGLACLAMVADFYGGEGSLTVLRSEMAVSSRGINLADIAIQASRLGLHSRAIRAELSDFPQIRKPCILHWNFDHFVVLKDVSKTNLIIHDPSYGLRRIPLTEASRAFTGIALELWPSQNIRERSPKQAGATRGMIWAALSTNSRLGLIFSIATLAEIIGLALPFYMQWVINQASSMRAVNFLTTASVALGLAFFLRQALIVSKGWLLIGFSASLNVQWRSEIFTDLLTLPEDYFEKRSVGDISSRFGSIDRIQASLTGSFFDTLLDGCVAVVTAVILFFYDTKLSIIVVASLVLCLIVRLTKLHTMEAARTRQVILAARQENHLLETIRGIRTIHAFQGEINRKISWLTHLVNQINAWIKAQKLQLWADQICRALLTLQQILVVWIGAKYIASNYWSAGAFVAFFSFKTAAEGKISTCLEKGFELRMLRVHLRRLSDIVDQPKKEIFPLNSGEDRIIKFQHDASNFGINVENLEFKYGESDPPLFNGITFSILPGECLAIAGPSGSGKTTLLKILAGSIKPTRGKLSFTLDDILFESNQDVRRHIGFVMQDDVLFDGTILDNITFFDASPDREWASECAEIASIHSEIKRMPMKYSTRVGDMGSALSGGQRQRIILARALYRRPKILMMDEATSNLDILKEAQVSDAIRGLNLTRIFVAHRPQTLASADRIITLNEGDISYSPN